MAAGDTKTVPLAVPALARPPVGTWHIPGSKSITNRALVLAALARGQSRIDGALESDDTRHMARSLELLGIPVSVKDSKWLVQGGRERLVAPKAAIFTGNSGTTLRFLTALAALVPGRVELDGDQAMRRRPIADLVDGLRQLGVRVDCENGFPPLTVHGGSLRGGKVTMPGAASSQYFSALMMAATEAEQALEVFVDGTLVSRPYVAMTQRMLRDFGGSAELRDDGFRVEPRALEPRTYAIEPDATAASYAFALAAGSGGSLTVPGLGAHSLQGDYRFLELLELAGARVERHDAETTVSGTGMLRGLDVDMRDISDTVMTLAALAVVAEGPTRIRNIGNIRIKESDRLLATVTELRRLGQHVEHGEDWIRIEPRPLEPALVHCYGDHRMAMSFAILGALRAGVSIEDPGSVEKTYPSFFTDLARVYREVGQDVSFRG